MITCTEKEERLLIRRRKVWHKVLRRTWYSFTAAIGLMFLVVPLVILIQAQKRLAYQNSMEAAQAMLRTSSQRSFILPVSELTHTYAYGTTEEGRLTAAFVDLLVLKGDSLGLTAEKRLGMHLELTVVPCGLFAKRHCAAMAEIHTSQCGCDTDSIIDKTALQLRTDSTGAYCVDVIASQEVTLTSIQP